MDRAVCPFSFNLVQFLIVKLLFLLAVPLFAQDRSRLEPGLATIKAANLRADLTFLASDALEGRMSLERGSDVAIQWIASEFAKAGLKPIAGDSFLQPVPLVEYRMDRAQTRPDPHASTAAAANLHAPDATGNYPNDGTYKGTVVFAGFGITAPELALRRLRGHRRARQNRPGLQS